MKTIAEAKALQKQKGLHFFNADAMRFFYSKIHGANLYGGRYFVTSERYDETSPRRYSVHEIDPETGRTSTVGDFQAYATLQGAREAAKRLAARK